MEKELLQRALDSILHGSTRIVSEIDSNGQPRFREERINDLRILLIQEIAKQLVNSEIYRDVFKSAFTSEIIKKIQENAIAKVSFNDLPYSVRKKIEEKLKNIEVEVKKYKLVVEVTDKEKVI